MVKVSFLSRGKFAVRFKFFKLLFLNFKIPLRLLRWLVLSIKTLLILTLTFELKSFRISKTFPSLSDSKIWSKRIVPSKNFPDNS